MIRLDNISKKYVDKALFTDTSLALKSNMRVGLVGPNGAGKTTLLRLMLGEEAPDRGVIVRDKAVTIGYLPQEIVAGSGKTILDEVLKVFPEVRFLENRIQEVSDLLADDPHNKKHMDELGRCQQEFEQLDGWNLENRAKEILSGLGFKSEQFHDTMDIFSGGWRMRVALGGLLLQNPDYLFLDEPTNHLDLEATIWLEEFLYQWQGSLVIISHDRVFLNKAVNNILEIENGTVTLFSGNYNQYQDQKAQRLELQKAAYVNQQKRITEIKRFIERFRYKNTKARQVQSRIKQLEKMKMVDEPVEYRRHLQVQIPQPERGPLIIANLKNVAKNYGETKVYQGLTLTFERGQRIGLVGPNGAGKSTLLKILAGVETITGGILNYGTEIKTAYFAQHQLEVLNPDSTVYESIQSAAPDWTISQIRGYLGSFLFTGDEVENLVKVLSGGEKSRLALARMLVQPANLLLLDEPTNHLDLMSRDVVEQALKSYRGTIVCISHDRHFLNEITNLTYEIDRGTITCYHGNYDYFLWKKQQEKVNQSQTLSVIPEKPAVITSPVKLDYRKQRRVKNRVRKVKLMQTELEQKIEANKNKLQNPAIVSDYLALQQSLHEEKELEQEFYSLLDELGRLEKIL